MQSIHVNASRRICNFPSLHMCFVAMFFLLSSASSFVHAQDKGKDGGKFDGALWTFEMVPHDKHLEKRNGMFRVEGMELYQKSDLSKPGFDRKVGQKIKIVAPRNKKGKPVGHDRTTLEFSDLQSNNRKYTGMKGVVELTKQKQGEWSGRFVDDSGLHWNFKCSRKQE